MKIRIWGWVMRHELLYTSKETICYNMIIKRRAKFYFFEIVGK